MEENLENKPKKEKKEKKRKMQKGEIAGKLIAIVIAAFMILSSCATLIYFIIASTQK